jgi:hypothetical protein
MRFEWETDKEIDYIKPESIYYPCVKCSYQITEREKITISVKGKWVHKEPLNPVKTYRLPAWYGSSDSWESICQKQRKCKNDLKALKDFYNNIKCEPFEKKDVAKNEQFEIVSKHQSRNYTGLFDKTSAIYLAIDVQQKGGQHFYYSIIAEEFETQKMRVLDAGIIESYAELKKLWEAKISDRLIDIAIIDEGDGNVSSEIRGYADSLGAGVYTYKGASISQRFTKNTQYRKGYIVNEQAFSKDLFDRIYTYGETDKYYLEIAPAVPPLLIKHLSYPERKITAMKTRIEKPQDKEKDPHFWDTVKMAIFASEICTTKRDFGAKPDPVPAVPTIGQPEQQPRRRRATLDPVAAEIYG